MLPSNIDLSHQEIVISLLTQRLHKSQLADWQMKTWWKSLFWFFYGKTEEIKTDIEVETRSNIAKSKFPELSKLLSSKRLKLKTKLKILNCFVFSIFTFGSEALTLSKVLEDKTEATEMWCLRKMSNIQRRDRVTNE